MKATVIGVLCIGSLVTCLGGCKCLNKPKGNFSLTPRRITIRTEPAGATVTQIHPLDQPPTELGTTPINDATIAVITNPRFKNMPLDDAQELIRHAGHVVVKITKDGYEPYHGALRTTPSETSVHEITLLPKAE